MSDYPSFDLSGQVALVTGAGRGIGNAIAQALANAGADVALGLRSADSAPELVATIEAMGRKALPLQMDVTERSQIEAAVERTVAHFGKLDLLVNNAGGGTPERAAHEVREVDLDWTLQANVKGTFVASQCAAKHMIRQNGGRIVNVGSQAGVVAIPGQSAYCMSKAAVAHMTKCFAVEWGQYNINVNNVAPTWIETPGTKEILEDPAYRADVLERIAALHRIGKPNDVAGAVLFLASPAAAMVTGATLLVDGGWTAR